LSVGKDIFKQTVVPTFQDLAHDVISDAADSFIYGRDSSGITRRRRSSSSSGSSSRLVKTGRISFEDYYDEKRNRRTARYVGDYNVEPLIFESRSDADSVMNELERICRRQGYVSVRELYKISGLSTSPTDSNWGWDKVGEFVIRRTRDGQWMIVCPDPIQL
jgi:hypothetical protein